MADRDLAQFFEDNQDEQYAGAPSPVTQRNDLTAFLLLDTLVPGTSDILGGADHDVVYLSVDPHKVNEVASDAQLLTLIRCGVLFDDEQDAFFMFV